MSLLNKYYSLKQIIKGIKNQDKKIICFIYDKTIDKIEIISIEIIGNKINSEDIFYDAVVSIKRQIDRTLDFKIENISFQEYFLAICKMIAQQNYTIKEYTDAEIVEEIKNDNNKVWQYMKITVYPMILNLVIKNSGNKEDAEDIYQQAIITVIRNIRDKPDFKLTSKFSTYFFAICQNLNLKRINRKTPDYEGDLSTIETNADDNIDDKISKLEAIKDLRFAISQLGEKCQKIIRLRDLEEMKFKEIGEKLGMKENTANQLHRRCLCELIKIMKKLNKF